MTPELPSKHTPTVAADLALLAVALVWGATFVMVKDALTSIGPFAFLFLRFLLAFAVLLPFCWRAIRAGGACLWRKGAVIGVWLFAGYGLQTVGLQWTTAGKAGFITGLSVVFVPLLAAALTRRRPSRHAMTGVALATVGLAMLTLGGNLRPGVGDMLVLGCAVCFAMHIISIGRAGADTTAAAAGLAVAQIGVTALLAGLTSLVAESNYWRAPGYGDSSTVAMTRLINSDVLVAIGVTAILATAAAFLIQNLAQRHTSPTHTALIFSTEPVFAAVFAWLLAGETFGLRAAAGAGLILAGILIAEVGPRLRSDDAPAEPVTVPAP
jgi:drug/metabolite transporter (DMT)-like permease